MLSWTSRFTGEQSPSEPAPAVRAPLGERALDALGEVVRAFGDGAFDVEGHAAVDVRQRCDAWARHLLVGASHPTDAAVDERSGRDFRGLRRFLSEQRRLEGQLVSRLRELVGSTAERIATMCNRDQADDRRIATSLVGLKDAAAHGSIEELRARVDETVGVAEEVFDRRRRRHAAEIASMGERLSSLRNELDEVRREASIDPLTQVFNRASLDRHLEAVVRLASFTNEPVCLLMVDVDHFKRINDGYGHVCGDEALRRVADNIVRVASRRTDFVARYGGEEFAVVLSDTPLQGASRVAERLVHTMGKAPIAIGGDRTIDVTVSVGVAHLGAAEALTAWVARADEALYRAKSEGRNRYLLAD
jgi:diguanylate cyclase